MGHNLDATSFLLEDYLTNSPERRLGASQQQLEARIERGVSEMSKQTQEFLLLFNLIL